MFDTFLNQSFTVNQNSDIKINFKFYDLREGDKLRGDNIETNHIIFILKGKLRVECSESESITLRSNSALSLYKGSFFAIEALHGAKILVFQYDKYLNFVNSFYYQNLSEVAKTIHYEFKPLVLNVHIRNFINTMLGFIEDDLLLMPLFELKQMELFMLFITTYPPDEVANFFFKILGVNVDFKRKVMFNYRNVKNAEELAIACGYERSAFQKKFKTEFGVSVYKWMIDEQVKIIRNRLADPTIPLKFIADEFDFSSHAHFSLFCKKYLGVPPTEYRKQKIQKASMLK